MAVSTLAALENSLKRIYSEEFFEAAINTAAPFWSMLQDEKTVEMDGEGYYWPFYLATPQNISMPAENSNVPVAKPRTEVQGRIRPAQFISSFELSFILEALGSARGAWNKGEVKRHMWESVTDLTKQVNRAYAGSHGTGRLTKVQAVSGATFTAGEGTVTATLGPVGTDEVVGAMPIQQNMNLEFRTADSSGTLRGSLPILVTKVATATRVVTTDTTMATPGVVAGDHVYLWQSYNHAQSPNGIMGLVDDGTLLDSIHNQLRSTYENLKSKVDSAAALRPLSEELILRNCFDVYQRSGQWVDALLMNTGEIERYLAFVRPDRRYNLSGRGVPAYQIGYDEAALELIYGGKRAEIKSICDLPARTVIGVTRSMLRRFTLRRFTWFDHGGGSIFAQGVDSNGPKTTKTATLVHLDNIGTFMPRAHFRIRDLSDPQLAGAAYGGDDV